jgi:hypothetical protein
MRLHIDPLDRFERERREGKRDERRDAIPGKQIDAARESFTDRAHAPDEHAAAAGDRIVMFAALAHERHHVSRHARRIAAVRFADLAERRGIDVERFDVAQDFVRLHDGCRVELPGRLRQGARRLEDAVTAEVAIRATAHAGDPANSSSARPSRSNGVVKTIVVFVRPMPGTALRRERKSSR